MAGMAGMAGVVEVAGVARMAEQGWQGLQGWHGWQGWLGWQGWQGMREGRGRGKAGDGGRQGWQGWQGMREGRGRGKAGDEGRQGSGKGRGWGNAFPHPLPSLPPLPSPIPCLSPTPGRQGSGEGRGGRDGRVPAGQAWEAETTRLHVSTETANLASTETACPAQPQSSYCQPSSSQPRLPTALKARRADRPKSSIAPSSIAQ